MTIPLQWTRHETVQYRIELRKRQARSRSRKESSGWRGAVWLSGTELTPPTAAVRRVPGYCRSANSSCPAGTGLLAVRRQGCPAACRAAAGPLEVGFHSTSSGPGTPCWHSARGHRCCRDTAHRGGRHELISAGAGTRPSGTPRNRVPNRPAGHTALLVNRNQIPSMLNY